jgi:hypothetical protein
MKVEEAEVPSVEELEKLLRELEKRQAEKEAIAVAPQPRLQQITTTTAVDEKQEELSFADLAKQFEELASRLELVEKAMTKGLCYHVKLPFAKDEEYATVCRYHDVDEKVAKLLIDLLFKYYKHAVASLQAIDELEECDSYSPNYHVVMFTDPVRLAVYPKDADLVYVFKLQEGEYPEIIRVFIDIENNKSRLRTICRVTSDHDIEAIKVNLLEALDMPLSDSGGA